MSDRGVRRRSRSPVRDRYRSSRVVAERDFPRDHTDRHSPRDIGRIRRDEGGRKDGGERRDYRPKERQNEQRRVEPRIQYQVQINNIPPEMDWQELKDLCKAEVGDLTYVELLEDKHRQRTGSAVAAFVSKQARQRAVKILNGFELERSCLEVFELDFEETNDNIRHEHRSSRDSRRDAYPQDNGRDLYADGGRRDVDEDRRRRYEDAERRSYVDGNEAKRFDEGQHFVPRETDVVQQNHDTFGLTPQFLESLGIELPLTNNVFVAQLDASVSAVKIHEIFSVAGTVLNVKLATKSDGTRRGFGVVEFEHPVEAVQAISMFNGATLYEQKMLVRLDKPNKINEGVSAREPVNRPVMENPPAHIRESGNWSGNVGLGRERDIMDPVTSVGVGNVDVGLSREPSNVVDPGLNRKLDITGLVLNSGMNNTDLQYGRTPDVLGGVTMVGGPGGMGAPKMQPQVSGLGGIGPGPPASSFVPTFSGMAAGPSVPPGMMYGVGGVGSSVAPIFQTATMGSAGPPMVVGGHSSAMSAAGMVPSGSGGTLTSDTICIVNLPPVVNWQVLTSKFQEIGNVVYSEMKSKDMGIMKYASSLEAQRAINIMNGARVDGQVISISLI